MQVLGRDRTLMRWLKHRGGAQHHRRWGQSRKDPLPAAAVIGADPGVTLAAVTPVPDTMSEYQFAGLLRGKRVELVDCVTVPIKVPATAEIVLEGHVSLDEFGDEGPYGDHTGYYNAVEPFPVFTVSAITMRRDPIYLSTFTGRPPDEPSVLGEALNDVFVPLLRQQFPEIVDFWLPPEGCSYRVAVVSIRKAYPGHARRIMMGVWSYLRQFMYTKFVIVVDDDIDCRDWNDVIWAISTRVDPGRDLMVVEHTPIDYLDFASPESGLGGKLGIDATDKWPPETKREWGRKLRMADEVVEKVTAQVGPLRAARERAGRSGSSALGGRRSCDVAPLSWGRPGIYIWRMDHDELLDAVLAAAREAGADAADAVLGERTSLDLSWRLGALEDLERKDAREIGLRVLVGRRVATTATTRTDPATLRALAEDAVAAARLLPEDPWVGLAEPASWPRAGRTSTWPTQGEPSLEGCRPPPRPPRMPPGRCRASPIPTAPRPRGPTAG